MFYRPLFRIIYHLRIYKSNHIFSQILGDSLGALGLAVISSGLYSHLRISSREVASVGTVSAGTSLPLDPDLLHCTNSSNGLSIKSIHC